METQIIEQKQKNKKKIIKIEESFYPVAVMIRMPTAIRNAIKDHAYDNHISMNKLCLNAILEMCDIEMELVGSEESK